MLAVESLVRDGDIRRHPLHGQVAAVSVGIWRGMSVLDLDYEEDAQAETDMNVVANDAGAFVELQGTAEGHAFRRDELERMLDLATTGTREIMQIQRAALDAWRAAARRSP
jgi:ribonuclease PH